MMTDLLSEMALQSALPFGLLLSVMALVIVAAVGTLGALRFSGRAQRLLAALVAVAVAGAARLVLGMTSSPLLHEDLNPGWRRINCQVFG